MRVLAATLTLVLIAATMVDAAMVKANVEPLPTALSEGKSSASVVWTGSKVYLFGGVDAALSDDIVEINPATGESKVMQAKLPIARSATSAVWTGSYAYIFGGFSGGLQDEILRYDPFSDTVTLLDVRLPSARSETAAVWTGSVAYIFGGFTGLIVDEIIKFDPAAGTAEYSPVHLPGGRSGAAAVWAGGAAYIFGGGVDGDVILKFDPASGTVASMTAELPTSRYRMGAARDGRVAYLFGGTDSVALDQILQFDPKADAVTLVDTKLPKARSEPGAVWLGSAALVVGGCCDDGVTPFRDLLRFEVPNLLPTAAFTATAVGLEVSADGRASTDPEGPIAAYHWDWGDGQVSSGPQAKHRYAGPAKFTITLSVTDSVGDLDSKAATITVDGKHEATTVGGRTSQQPQATGREEGPPSPMDETGGDDDRAAANPRVDELDPGASQPAKGKAPGLHPFDIFVALSALVWLARVRRRPS